MIRTQDYRAYTLIETLVVIGLLGLLLSIILPATQYVRSAAARLACQNDLKQIGLALHAYHDQNGRLPPLPVKSGFSDPNSTLSWMGHILPQIDQQQLWAATVAAYRNDSTPYHDPPHIGYSTVVKTYVCAADARLLSPLANEYGMAAAYGSYLGISGATVLRGDGVFGREPGIRLTDVTDGTSSTIAVGERPPPQSLQVGRWYTGTSPITWTNCTGPELTIPAIGSLPNNDPLCSMTPLHFHYGRLDNPCDRLHLWSLHSGGANFAFADGSVRFLSYSADSIMPALATRAGGEMVAIPE
jgi:prepilin-type processing-associated H-X9-DG protein